MTADAGLASDSSETDFRLAAVLGNGSGRSITRVCVCVCWYVCWYVYISIYIDYIT